MTRKIKIFSGTNPDTVQSRVNTFLSTIPVGVTVDATLSSTVESFDIMLVMSGIPSIMKTVNPDD